jgi:hypothetical protein
MPDSTSDSVTSSSLQPRLVWDQGTIAWAMREAETCGSCRLGFYSQREARLFRYACYTWRKTHNRGRNLTLTITSETSAEWIVKIQRIEIVRPRKLTEVAGK